MKDGFIKVAAITPEVKIADCEYNGTQIIKEITKTAKDQTLIAVFPELAITSYSCRDLFLRKDLLEAAKRNILKIANATAHLDIISIIGAPIDDSGTLYNCAVVLHHGKILGIVPKQHIPNYSEFYEKRYFAEGLKHKLIPFGSEAVHFGTDLLFKCTELPELTFGVEICEDLWAAHSPSIDLAQSGANLILNLSASNEQTDKATYRKELIKVQSKKLTCAYVYASAGEGESTTDLVFSGHNIIAETGSILAESKLFSHSCTSAFVDLQKIEFERRRIGFLHNDKEYTTINFNIKPYKYNLIRNYSRYPFIPNSNAEISQRCELILQMQVSALKKRLTHIGAQKVIIGISGGLDSTLALIVAVRTFESLQRNLSDIITVTMPCFGTTSQTFTNAKNLINEYKTTYCEINIADSVKKHFQDIGQDENVYDLTYENAQARERTQVLMDIANKENGLVLGTGDMSELFMGYTTYNGDHMSMYAINASLPKTLIRCIVSHEAVRHAKQNKISLADTLKNIVYTPISPELLPAKDDKMTQQTENIIGSYELIDFFMYYYLRFGFSKEKIFRLAKVAFINTYDNQTLQTRFDEFEKRFYSQQYKRSCMPDGPKVGPISISPRGDLRLASDVSFNHYL